MFGFARPERFSNAGVWIAPQAAITARERIVTVDPSAVLASTPRAAPPDTRTRATRVPTTSRAPAAWASDSHVLTTDCLAPTRQPNGQ